VSNGDHTTYRLANPGPETPPPITLTLDADLAEFLTTLLTGSQPMQVADVKIALSKAFLERSQVI
jgi:hypothetical protein